MRANTLRVEDVAQTAVGDPAEQALKALLGGSHEAVLAPDDLLRSNGAFPDVLISWSRSIGVATQLFNRGYRHQQRFAVLPSRARARWLLPQSPGLAAGFELYTPFSTGARLLKALLTKVRATGWQGWARHRVLIASQKPLALEALACEVTGVKQVAFAVSLGTPGLFQKLTVQVMSCDGRILCYAKLPLTARANKRLEHEARVLQALQRFPNLRPRIPRLLYAGTETGGYVLMQARLEGKPGPARFLPIHGEFLKSLHECDSSMVPGRNVVREVAREWDGVAPRMETRLQTLGRDALRVAARELDGSQVLCGISHGDFAPWNTRVHRSELCLFDWESSRIDAPCVWDQFHFLAQTESLLSVKHPVRGVADVRLRNRSLYLLYLLHSTAQLLDEQAAEGSISYRERQLSRHLTEATPVK